MGPSNLAKLSGRHLNRTPFLYLAPLRYKSPSIQFIIFCFIAFCVPPFRVSDSRSLTHLTLMLIECSGSESDTRESTRTCKSRRAMALFSSTNQQIPAKRPHRNSESREEKSTNPYVSSSNRHLLVLSRSQDLLCFFFSFHHVTHPPVPVEQHPNYCARSPARPAFRRRKRLPPALATATFLKAPICLTVSFQWTSPEAPERR